MSQFSTYLEIIQEAKYTSKKYDLTSDEIPKDTRDLSEDLSSRLGHALGFSFFAVQVLLSILLFDAIHFNKLEKLEPTRARLAEKAKKTIKNWYEIKKDEKDKIIENLKKEVADYLKQNDQEKLNNKLKDLEEIKDEKAFLQKHPDLTPKLNSNDLTSRIRD
jgi:hypothetical protein